MNIERREIAPLTEEIVMTIHKEDYEPKFLEELRKQRQKSNLKGFRKGKTPTSVIRKMFGKSILGEIVQKAIQENIEKYLQDEQLKTIGHPIPAENQSELDLDTKNLQDFTYTFEIGKAPDLTIQGLTKENTFSKYTVVVEDEKIEEEIASLRKRMGEFEEVEGDSIELADMVDLEAVELEDGQIKEKGWETYFSITVDRLVDADLQKEIQSKKKGDLIRVDLTNLENNTDQKFINKYYLNLDEDEQKDIGNHFEGKIAKVRRLKMAELNEDFFKQAFGKEEIKSVEDAKAEIISSYQDAYGKQADVLLFRDLQDHLMEQNPIELPKDYLKRWLIVSNPEVTEESVELEFDAFKEGLRWNLIREDLIKKYDIKVEIEDIKASFRSQLLGYLGNQVTDTSFIDSTVDRMMANQEQVNKVYEDILFDKLYENMEQDISIDPQPISLTAFEELLQKKQQNSAAADVEEE